MFCDSLRKGFSLDLAIVSDGAGQFATSNQTLKRLYAHKGKLPLVLKRPDIVLHTNGGEGDIRGFVKWRKISGGTRSDFGRR